MASSRPFAYNPIPPNSLISGTTQLGDLAVGVLNEEYVSNYGGVRWWNGPDEDLGYVIAVPVSGNTQPTPNSGETASIGFYRSKFLTNPSFLEISDYLGNEQGQPPFPSTQDAYAWLTNQGYWTSFIPVTPTPTATLALTPTPTTTETPTPTPTPTNETALINPIITELDEYIEVGTDLYLMFSEAVGPSATPSPTPTNTETPTNTPTETETPTPTPTETSTPTPSVTNTETPTNTPTPTITPTNISCLNIATNAGGGLTGFDVGGQAVAFSILSNPAVGTTYPVGSFITFQNGEVRTFVGYDDYGAQYDVFYDSPISSLTLFPITICYPSIPTSTPTPTPTNTETPTNTPTVTQTPSSTDLTNITTYTISGCTSLNVFVANLGPGALAPGDVFYFEFTGGTPSGCYRIVNKIDAAPTDGTTPLYFYSSCALCVAAREVTPTPTVTQTPTTTPTNTPTPSTSPIPVTGYSFNLVDLPYNFPTSGNSIMNGAGGATSGSTDVNVLATGGRGFYLNAIDSNSVDRTNYFSAFTGQSVTITLSQTGSTAIYSGDTNSFKQWIQSPMGSGFVFGAQIGVPPSSTVNGTAVLIQSATTLFTIGLPVYVSLQINGLAVTPTLTPTPTSTPASTVGTTPTPTLTPTGTPASTPGETPTLTPTGTPASTPGETPTLTPTGTPASTPGETPTPTPTGTPAETPGATPGETPTLTPTGTPASTPGETPTPTPTGTPAETPGATPGETPTLTPTPTPTGFEVTLPGAASTEFGSCSSGPINFYISSSSVASAYGSSGDVSLLIGYILYEDITLTIPTTNTYVSDSNGDIWQVISSSIVSTTGNNCG